MQCKSAAGKHSERLQVRPDGGMKQDTACHLLKLIGHLLSFEFQVHFLCLHLLALLPDFGRWLSHFTMVAAELRHS